MFLIDVLLYSLAKLIQKGDNYEHVVSPSFDARLHSDAILGHMSSILAMRHVHNVVGEVLSKYTDGPEYDAEQGVSDAEIINRSEHVI